MPEDQLELLELELGADVPRLALGQLIPDLFNRANEPGLAKLFDDTLIAIAIANHGVFCSQQPPAALLRHRCDRLRPCATPSPPGLT